jgi:hypothetical protein
MTLTETPGALKRFRKTTWKFQRTFQTPLRNLQTFVTAIVSATLPLKGGSFTVEQVVFEPKHLNEILTRYSIPLKYQDGLSFIATDPEETEALLLAALSDWVDFLFIPDPKPFVVYADHDEYTTFFAQTRSNLNRVISALSDQRFESIQGYERRL